MIHSAESTHLKWETRQISPSVKIMMDSRLISFLCFFRASSSLASEQAGENRDPFCAVFWESIASGTPPPPPPPHLPADPSSVSHRSRFQGQRFFFAHATSCGCPFPPPPPSAGKNAKMSAVHFFFFFFTEQVIKQQQDKNETGRRGHRRPLTTSKKCFFFIHFR